jgi:hypothetical protein
MYASSSGWLRASALIPMTKEARPVSAATGPGARMDRRGAGVGTGNAVAVACGMGRIVLHGASHV